MKDENGKEIDEEEFLIVRNKLRDEIIEMLFKGRVVDSVFEGKTIGGSWRSPELENIIF